MRMVDWPALTRLADTLQTPQAGPDTVSAEDWWVLEQALAYLRQQRDWPGLIQLRLLLGDICARDTFTGSALIRELEASAIQAAEALGDTQHMAQFLGDQGHNLHRQGFHQEALAAFDASSIHYAELGNQTFVLYNEHMTALCYRALDQWERAHAISQKILTQVRADDPWRGHPLQVLAWLYQDKLDWVKAEACLREALGCFTLAQDSDILVAGALSDLGELLGLQGRTQEAQDAFMGSLSLLALHKGQYARHEARTKLKLADMLAWQGAYEPALQLLREADELCCMYGHYYDELWKVEMAMAAIFLRQRRIVLAVKKLMSAFHIRRSLGLPNRRLVRQVGGQAMMRLLAKLRRAAEALRPKA